MATKTIWDERARVAELVKAEAVDALFNLEMDQMAFDYAISSRAYQRTPVFCTFWCSNDAKRDILNRGIGLHCLGIKLVDDMLDEDTQFSSTDLSLGVYLIQTGTSMLCTAGDPDPIHHALQRHYRNIWRAQMRELRRRPQTLTEWLAIARVKSGEILECYTNVVCCVANIEPDLNVHFRWASALGTLIMIRDDLKDFYEKNETNGNLAHLIMNRIVNVNVVHELIRELSSAAQAAIECIATDFDLKSVVTTMESDAHERLIKLPPS